MEAEVGASSKAPIQFIQGDLHLTSQKQQVARQLYSGVE